eukprot:scaffold312_cov409-Pavlova_lutheri.AAC.18
MARWFNFSCVASNSTGLEPCGLNKERSRAFQLEPGGLNNERSRAFQLDWTRAGWLEQGEAEGLSSGLDSSRVA